MIKIVNKKPLIRQLCEKRGFSNVRFVICYFVSVDSFFQRYLAPSNSVMTAFNIADRSSCSSLISSWNKETSFGIISWLPKVMIFCSRLRSRWYNSSISWDRFKFCVNSKNWHKILLIVIKSRDQILVLCSYLHYTGINAHVK